MDRLSGQAMLLIELSQIGPEGLDLDAPLDVGGVHIQGEDTFTLAEGGRLRARLEMGDEQSVHVQGHLSARLRLECGRCLDGFEMPVEQELDLFYLPQSANRAPDEEEDEVELSDRDLVVAYYRGARLDLGEMVREQLFLALPLKRVCSEACQGLCPSCGAHRGRVQCGCPKPVETDSRLAPLKDLFDKGSPLGARGRSPRSRRCRTRSVAIPRPAATAGAPTTI
jgi:uncharacterized protein